MADIKSKEARSRNMAAIRSKDTKPEVYLRTLLFSRGFRYRKNTSAIFGHPDLYLLKHHVAIFVHGCYWHRHKGCKYAYTPKSKIDFWNNKFETNIRRDTHVRDELEKQGVRQLVVWECTIRQMMQHHEIEDHVLNSIEHFCASDIMFLEI